MTARLTDTPPSLTGREREVLALLGAGHTNPEIAQALQISVNTVKNHVEKIFNKLGGAHTRCHAVALADQAGVLR